MTGSLSTDRLGGTGTLQPVTQTHWFGTTDMPGEPTGSEALRIVPDVRAELTRPGADGPVQRHQLRYTGSWSLLHTPSGSELSAGHWMPLVWLRRYARLLAECGIDWQHVTGDPGRVDHPQHLIVRTLGAHVLDCWRRGVPVGPGLGVSLHLDASGVAGLQCCNRHCEDDLQAPAVLSGMGEDGQDDARTADVDELYDLARYSGWARLGESGWLCEACAVGHQAAPERLAGRLTYGVRP